MNISRKELWEKLVERDVTRMKEIWDCFQLTKDSGPHVLEDDNREIALTTLRFAAAASYSGSLPEAMGKEIYERMAGKVEFFGFINAIAFAMDIDVTNITALPEWARTAAIENDCETLAKKIDILTPDAFAALLAFFITGEVREVNFKTCMPIIRRLYGDEVIPNDLLFSMMASCLHDTAEHRMAEFAGRITGLFTQCPTLATLLVPFAFSCADSDDESDHKKANDGDDRCECCDHPDDPTS